MILQGGPNVYGMPIGILCLESYYTKVPGHIKNATTFDFPVMFKVIEGATPKEVVDDACGDLLESFIEAAQELEREGVAAITGSCGFMILFQEQIANAVNIPVYLSSLLQIPLVSRMIRSDQKVGLLVAKKKALTKRHLECAGAESVPLCIAGMDDKREFCDVIIDRKKKELDIDLLEKEVLDEVDKLYQANPDIGVFVIECTDLPPFAYLIQERINKPVFDILTMTNMVYQSMFRKPYQGIIPRQ